MTLHVNLSKELFMQSVSEVYIPFSCLSAVLRFAWASTTSEWLREMSSSSNPPASSATPTTAPTTSTTTSCWSSWASPPARTSTWQLLPRHDHRRHVLRRIPGGRQGLLPGKVLHQTNGNTGVLLFVYNVNSQTKYHNLVIREHLEARVVLSI